MPEPKERRWAFMSKKIIGSQDNPMLIRWRLIQTPLFGIYLHFIHREDLDRLPHDHPWTFWTWIIRGSYAEDYWADARCIGSHTSGAYSRSQVRRRWSTRRFSQTSAHRITAVHGHVTTLVIVGKKNRTWGFYDGAGRFIDWREYHAVANGWSDQQRHEAMRSSHLTDVSVAYDQARGSDA